MGSAGIATSEPIAAAALALKVDKTTTVNAKALSANVTLTTADIADSTDKRYVSDAQESKVDNCPANTTSELAAKEATANKGAASGYAPLDSGSKVPVTNLPAASGAAAGTLASGDYTKLTHVPADTNAALDARPPTIVSGTSGEAITAGYAVGVKNASGVPKVYKASAASGSTPLVCTGIATTTVAGADLAISVQSSGLSGVIPDAAWDSVPGVANVGAPVYLSKTAGKLTIDVSAFLAADSKQSLGTLAVGGTGACKVMLNIDSPALSTSDAALAPLLRTIDLARGPTNVALGRSYTATAGYGAYAETSGSALTDGVQADRLYTAAAADVGWYSASPHTDEWICDLGQTCLISQTMQYTGTGYGIALFPAVTVSVSPDGTNWRQLGRFTATHLEAAVTPGNLWVRQSFAPCLGRYVKLEFTNAGAVWTMLGEIQVWGVPMGAQQAANLVFTGDSLTQAATYPNAVVAGLTTGCAMTNVALIGATMEGLIVADVTAVDPLLSPGSSNAVFVWAGTNDLFFGATAAATEGFIQAYCLARKAAGWDKVLIATILPRSNVGTPVGFEAARVAVNIWLRAHWTEFADALMDFSADSRIGEEDDDENAFFYADLVHMTATGYGIVAGIALNAYATLD